MKSHICQFTAADALKLALLPLLPVVAFAIIIQAAGKARLLPDPRPALDVDRTILIHQAEAAQHGPAANLIVLGDSTSLMDVSAPALQKDLGGDWRVLDLGTLSYLDLNGYARLLRQYIQNHPGNASLVVLLLHPEALRPGVSQPYFASVLESYLLREDFCTPRFVKLFCWLGIDVFHARISSRLFPPPLPGVYGRYYGFANNLWTYLDEHQGSAIDPRAFHADEAHPIAKFRAGKTFQEQSENFRAAMPQGIKLAVGITPVPETFSLSSFPQARDQMLQEWGSWLKADIVLSNLPPTLTEAFFSSTTHLNEKGNEEFTQRLGRALKERLLTKP